MKIGLMAYHAACNFGATLQLLSTYMYLKNQGHEPMIINWVAEDLEAYYRRTTPAEQYTMQEQVRSSLWSETESCRTEEDVARVIEYEIIEAVIIGSDAVAQHHSFLERLTFPCRTIVGMLGATSDTQFPNPFWATWLPLLPQQIPVAVMSASNQDSSYRLFSPSVRRDMAKCVERYSYLSVRDEWTQKMFVALSHGKRQPKVTPDPVFAFNQNVAALLPSRQDILQRFGLPDKYVLLSFLPTQRPSVSQEWLDEFSALAATEGYACVMLPFSHKESFGKLSQVIALPLNPIDWYALIKYSAAYVGNNMHPIIVAIHNQIPFFSFDTYGTKHFNGLYVDESSSKIRHILNIASFPDYRIGCTSRHFVAPTPSKVWQKLACFDRNKCENFALSCLENYNQMMNDIIHSFAK